MDFFFETIWMIDISLITTNNECNVRKRIKNTFQSVGLIEEYLTLSTTWPLFAWGMGTLFSSRGSPAFTIWIACILNGVMNGGGDDGDGDGDGDYKWMMIEKESIMIKYLEKITPRRVISIDSVWEISLRCETPLPWPLVHRTSNRLTTLSKKGNQYSHSNNHARVMFPLAITSAFIIIWKFHTSLLISWVLLQWWWWWLKEKKNEEKLRFVDILQKNILFNSINQI